MSFDVTLFYALHGLTGHVEWFDTLMLFAADGFDLVVIILAITTLLVIYDPRPDLKYTDRREIIQRVKGFGEVTLATFVSWAVVDSLKILFTAPRPFIALPDVTPLFYYGGFDSFPSAHAALFGALAVALFIYKRKLGVIFGVFALLIGFSRIVVGIHFPFDILAGYAIGGMIAWVVYYSYKYIKQHVTVEVEL